MNEYIVTCRSYEDLDNLYTDMETLGGSLYIPDRAVDLVHRRPISRNTHYMLTEEEAVEIRNDERVIACERLAKDRGIIPDYLWTQTGDFEKTSGSLQSDDKNWGLYRAIEGDTSYTAAGSYSIDVTASNSLAYTLSGTDRNGSVSGNNATVNIRVGDTINFVVNASTHPFFIRVSDGGANVSTPAATNQGTQSGTVSWTPNTVGTYYYQCGSHGGMIGTIIVSAQVANWGSDSTTEISNRTIVTTASGKNVDVVIVDLHANPDHPEFAVNSDGTGGSRVNQFNWFQYNSVLGYGANGTYTYSTSSASPNGNHGTHVAGTACGNTQGWARDANIYNMAFQDDLVSPVTDWDEKLWDYLRHFHQNKAINPATGRRNPTITNHSWGYSYSDIQLSTVTSVRYRGTITSVSGTNAEKRTVLEDNGVPVPAATYLYKLPARVAAVDADIQDAINDGVIVISSAGNSYWNCDTSGGDDYDNYTVNSGSTKYHSRGSTPGSANNVICVGSIGSKVAEYKSNFSNWGERVDIWAPGSDIISAIYDNANTPSSYNPVTTDPRNSSYYLASINGTSMASPQVCGIIACLAEQEPDLTQAEALQHLKENALAEVGTTGTINHNTYEAFGDSHNRYLFMPKKRPGTGALSPAVLHKNRNPDTAGVKYPRVRNNRVFQ